MKVWGTEHRRISWMLNYIIKSRFLPASHVSSGWLGCNLSISTCSLHQSWAINHQTNLDHCPPKRKQSDGSCHRCISFFLFVPCRNIFAFLLPQHARPIEKATHWFLALGKTHMLIFNGQRKPGCIFNAGKQTVAVSEICFIFPCEKSTLKCIYVCALFSNTSFEFNI